MKLSNRKLLQLAMLGLGAAAANAAMAADVSVGGQVRLDHNNNSYSASSKNTTSKTDLSKVDLSFKSKLDDDWSSTVVVGQAAVLNEAVDIKVRVAEISYSGLMDGLTLSAGKFKASLGQHNAKWNTMFMPKSMGEVIFPTKGVKIAYSGDMFAAKVHLTSDGGDITTNNPANSHKAKEEWSVSGRVGMKYDAGDATVFGGLFGHNKNQNAVDSAPTAKLRTNTLGVNAGAAMGPFGAVLEWNSENHNDAAKGTSAKNKATEWSGVLAYNVTGESVSADNYGYLSTGVSPSGDMGAVQLVAGYHNLKNHSDETVKTTVFGANWFVTSNVTLKLEHKNMTTTATPSATVGNERELKARLQWTF